MWYYTTDDGYRSQEYGYDIAELEACIYSLANKNRVTVYHDGNVAAVFNCGEIEK